MGTKILTICLFFIYFACFCLVFWCVLLALPQGFCSAPQPKHCKRKTPLGNQKSCDTATPVWKKTSVCLFWFYHDIEMATPLKNPNIIIQIVQLAAHDQSTESESLVKSMGTACYRGRWLDRLMFKFIWKRRNLKKNLLQKSFCPL